MAVSPRDLVKDALTFNSPARIPRDMWFLPWFESHYPQELKEIQARYPSDLTRPVDVYRPSSRRSGNWYDAGTYVDDWGCVFENIHPGVHGEVRQPVMADINDWSNCAVPWETLPEDTDVARDAVNRWCGQTDHFVMGNCCPRPWERFQFLRGTENAMMDMMSPQDGAAEVLKAIHEFYLREIEFWASTDVDALMFMDDWGSQLALLIPPPIWRDIFKPMYRDYCDIARSYDKFVFMHSDGHIQAIYPDLIEIGVNALNSQIFCMDMPALAQYKGKITFWGEIDRQHVLLADDPQVARQAVRDVAQHLYLPTGGIIAQFELGSGAKPANASAIFDQWDKIHQQAQA